MNLSTKSRYGLRALTHLVSQDKPISIQKIAKIEHISKDYLEKIFSKLKKAGILKVKKGASGGYMLKTTPDKITIKQIVDTLEKTEFSCPHDCFCQSKSIWQQLELKSNQFLESITLDELKEEQSPIYLDYAASTPIDPQVLNHMLKFFDPQYSASTSSLHQLGLKAARVVEKSRNTFAKLLNTSPETIVFTSSATESNNTVLKGVAFANQKKGKHIIISSIEHDCVLESANWLETQGFEITKLPVDSKGFINLKTLEKSIRKDTILLSIIHGSNEIGTIQDIERIGKICKQKNLYFHTDASQSFTKVPIDVKKNNITFLTASSHKIYGPKGVGLLYIKPDSKIIPLLHGGGQESGFRSSTVNTPLIAGFAKAAQIAVDKMSSEEKRLSILRDYLIKQILSIVPETSLNGPKKNRLNNNVNVSFEKIEGESLLLTLDHQKIICSTGSACSSKSLEPSHVLLSIGKKPEQAHSSIRFSLGRFTTKQQLDYLLKILPQAVKRLRTISPFK